MTQEQAQLFPDHDYAEPAKPSKWDLLKGQQKQVADITVQWLQTPVDPTDITTIIGTIRGYAGTGKSFMMGAIVEQMVGALGIHPTRIIGITPTHATATNLAEYAHINTSTAHSFLGLRMMKVKLSPDEKRDLEDLRTAKATAVFFSPEDELRLRLLVATEGAEQEKKKELRPTMAPESFAKAWSGDSDNDSKIWPEVVIVDEAFMFNKELITNLYTLVAFNPLLPVPKILCVGDPGQVPPIGEVISEAINFPVLGELTEPVRQEGILLEYVTAVRKGTAEDIKGAHYPYLQEGGDSFFQLGQDVVLDYLPQVIKDEGLGNFRILTTSNARVQELNLACYKAMYPIRPFEIPYKAGEILLTKGPVMRDPAYPNVPGATDGDILFSTSTPITIDQAYTPMERTNILGTSYSVSCLDCYSGKHTAQVVAIHPLQIADWLEEKDIITKMAQSCTWKNFNKPQKGIYAKRVWAALGLQNWEKLKPRTKLEKLDNFAELEERWEYLYQYYGVSLCPGKAVTNKAYQAIGKWLWRSRYEHQQMADNLSLSFASTTHTAQGLTIPICVIDLVRFFPRANSNQWQSDGTWDSHKIFYTAISRVGDANGSKAQLILMRGGVS